MRCSWKKKRKNILKAFELKKKKEGGVKTINLQLRGCWRKCRMREEGNFWAKTSSGIQDFIFCAKKPGNKYKIQEICRFCVESRGFAYHRQEGVATRSHLVPSLWKTLKITKNCCFMGKIHVNPAVSPEAWNNAQITPKCILLPQNIFFIPVETCWGLFWPPLPLNLLQRFQIPWILSKIPQIWIQMVFLPKLPHLGSKYFSPQSPPPFGQNVIKQLRQPSFHPLSPPSCPRIFRRHQSLYLHQIHYKNRWI